MKLFLLIIGLLFITYFCSAQVTVLSGKVTDENTGAPIAGVSVFVNHDATSTDAKGEFTIVVNRGTAMQYGITLSCIGYKKQHIDYKETPYYQVKLQPVAIALKGVVILADAESILRKAIRKIPENYPAKDFMMDGILRMYEISKDSLAVYRYYKNDAVLKIYYPSYLKSTDRPQVSLIQNRDTLLEDRVRYQDSIKSIGKYSIVPSFDFVHNRVSFIMLKDLKKFTYVNQGKGYINGTRVYIINFFSAFRSQLAGTLYIDTASYAFVSGAFTRYNIRSPFFLTIDKSTSIINYKKVDGKWYLDAIKTTFLDHHKKRELYHTIDYKTISIDTAKATPLSYHERIQYFTEDIKLAKPGTNDDWLKNKPLFENAARDTIITKMEVPPVDTNTTPITQGKARPYRPDPVMNYLRNDNYRLVLQLSRLPFSVANYQPLLSKNVNGVVTWLWGFDFQLRVYKGLFVQLDNDDNYGDGGLKAASTTILLTYNFEFNTHHHPITFSPLFGYNEITFSGDKIDYFSQKSLVSGFTLAYEVTHRLNYFAGIKYMHPLSSYNAGLILNAERIYPSAGILYKIK